MAVFIGNGVSRFGDLYPFAGNGVAIADDDGAPLRRRGKIGGNPKLGRSGANGRIEHRLEQLLWLTKHWTFPATPRTGRRPGIKLTQCRPDDRAGRTVSSRWPFATP